MIGETLTASGARYIALNPGLTAETLLFHAGGDATLIWTKDSIERCRWNVFAAESLWAPLHSRRRSLWFRLSQYRGGGVSCYPDRSAQTTVELPVIYDAFLSYRHSDTDRRFARDILQILEDSGYRVAIDERDFRPEESFLDELERCIRQSRYTLAVVSGEYIESGNCHEEAVVSKVLSMSDRRNRLSRSSSSGSTFPHGCTTRLVSISRRQTRSWTRRKAEGDIGSTGSARVVSIGSR